MNASNLALMGILVSASAFAAVGNDPDRDVVNAQAVDPDVVVVEHDWIIPLRMDSVDSLNRAREYYRRDNERAAADEVRKAASWLAFAAGDAYSHTKQALESARTDLLTLADDLDTGKVTGAARLDTTLTQASRALAEWHYYRARDEFGKSDAYTAARDLEAAAAHLEAAAASAHLQFGPDTVTVFEDIYRDGKMITEGRDVDYDLLGKRLDGIENAIETMADALKQSYKE